MSTTMQTRNHIVADSVEDTTPPEHTPRCSPPTAPGSTHIRGNVGRQACRNVLAHERTGAWRTARAPTLAGRLRSPSSASAPPVWQPQAWRAAGSATPTPRTGSAPTTPLASTSTRRRSPRAARARRRAGPPAASQGRRGSRSRPRTKPGSYGSFGKAAAIISMLLTATEDDPRLLA
jgi:hypothetical protein